MPKMHSLEETLQICCTETNLPFQFIWLDKKSASKGFSNYTHVIRWKFVRLSFLAPTSFFFICVVCVSVLLCPHIFLLFPSPIFSFNVCVCEHMKRKKSIKHWVEARQKLRNTTYCLHLDSSFGDRSIKQQKLAFKVSQYWKYLSKQLKLLIQSSLIRGYRWLLKSRVDAYSDWLLVKAS